MTVRTLQSIRSDDNFKRFWAKFTNVLDTEEPVLPRKQKRPRYESGKPESYSPESVEQFYRTVYFEALDLLVSGIKDRFDHPGYKVYSNLEALLVKSSNGQKCAEELQFVKDFYKDEFDN